MKSALRAATLLALIALPSLASAQRRINGLVMVGFAPTGSSDPYATTGGGFGRVGRRVKDLAPGITVREDELHVDAAMAKHDPLMALRVAVIAARENVAIEREEALDR